jgi:hypothetical protein
VAVPVDHFAGTAPHITGTVDHFTGMQESGCVDRETKDGNEMMLIPPSRHIPLD